MRPNRDSQVVKWLSRYTSFSSILASAFGLMVLAGWSFHIRMLKGFFPSQVAVKANAGLCFVLIGLALWILRKENAPLGAQLLAKALATFAAIVGLLSFFEYLRGWDLGIDRLLFAAGAEDAPGSVRPGLMSPIAALGFLLCGTALLLLNCKRPRLRRAPQLFCMAAAIISIFGILDFVLDPNTTHTHIAPLTALTLFLFSFGLICARTDSGLGALMVSSTLGGTLTRRLFPAAIGIPIAIAWLRWKGQEAGLYSDWTGLALMTVSAATLLATVTAWTASFMDRADGERKEAESAARRLASIVTSSNDAIIVKTLDGIVMDWNPAAEKIYGYSAREMVGRSVNVLVPPERLAEFQSIMQRIAHGEEMRHYEIVRLRKDRQIIDVSLSVSPLKDEKGKIIGASTIARDITERKRAEEEVRNAAIYTRSLIEASLDPLVTIRKDGKIMDVNRATELATGLSREQLIGTDFSNYFSEPEKARAGYERVFAEESVRDYPLALRHTSGRLMEVLYNASVFKNEHGEVEGVFAAARDVTERKRAEEQVRKASLYTRSLIEASLDPLVTIRKDGQIMDVNRATELATGCSREQLIGTDFSEYFTDPANARSGYERVFAEESVRDYPLALRHTSGRVMEVLYNATVFKNKQGEVEGVFAAARDVTERKRAEEQVRKASLYTRSLIEASPDPLVTIRKDGQIMDVNRATELATGLTRERLIGTDFSEYFTDPANARSGYERVFAEESVRDYPLALRHTSGRVMEVLYNATVFKNKQGEVEGVFAAARDVTERKRAEEQVRKASLYTRSLIEASPDPLVTIRKDGQIMDVNRATELATGLTREQLIGTDFSSYFSEPEKARAGYERVFAEQSVRNYPLAIRHTSGRVMEVLYHASVFKNKHGEVEGVFAAARDITERRRAEEALNRSETRYRSLVTATSQIVWTTNPQGEVVEDMPSWRAFAGMKQEEMRGSGWLNSLHPADRERTAEIWGEAVRERRLYDTEYRVRRQDGEYRMMTVRGVPVMARDGTITEWVGTCTDITERKQAEEEVRRLNGELEERVRQRTAELEAANKELEAFTYSVSHDLRAPLRHISGFSKILSEEYGPHIPAEAQHHLLRIEEGTRRMGLLVDDLLNLGRVGRSELRLQVAGLNSVVNEVVSELKKEYEGREIEWKIGNLPYIECDPSLMKQVFQNLLSNAVKFTRPRSKATIEIGQKEQDGTAVVFVRDNGVGFSMKYSDKLFGVFQRLHRQEDFEGTGVGLATVQRIIQKHGGRIWAEAELEKGATFYFTLGNSEKSEFKVKTAGIGS